MHSHLEIDSFKGRRKSRGRPHKTWNKTVTEDLKAWNIDANNARDQPVWKKVLRTAMKNPSHGNCGQVAQNGWVTFNLYEFVSTCKKRLFIDSFWRYGWLKNPAIWLAKNIFAHIPGTKTFPNMEFVQGHSKKHKTSL